jgi:poly-gamma-glutamate synthesis protein (capsule biosynthesis protein)
LAGLFLGVFIGNYSGSGGNKPTHFLANQIVSPTPAPKIDQRIRIVAAGDVLLGRSINFRMVRDNNFNWPFEKVADLLREADFSFINLEGPLVEDCPLTQTGMVFCGDRRAASGLVFAGVGACNLANNHILNYGEDGLKQTIDVLSQNNIGAFGEEKILRKNIKGVNFSFLGFNEVGLGNRAYERLLLDVADKIKQEKEFSDVVVVSFHWGNEYTEDISPRQKQLGYLAIDSGADIVVGHHPHWVQSKEIYKDKPIYYSLGNFVFDQMWSQKTREGLIVSFEFEGKNLLGEKEFPVLIEDFGQPRFIGEN